MTKHFEVHSALAVTITTDDEGNVLGVSDPYLTDGGLYEDAERGAYYSTDDDTDSEEYWARDDDESGCTWDIRSLGYKKMDDLFAPKPTLRQRFWRAWHKLRAFQPVPRTYR